MARRGGARPGAGRKRKAEKFPSAAAMADAKIAERLPQILDNLFALSDGVKVKSADGSVYTQPPDREACKYLVDRLLGRPTEKHQVGGKDGGPLQVVLMLPDNQRDGTPDATG